MKTKGKIQTTTVNNPKIKSKTIDLIKDLPKIVFDQYNEHHKETYHWGLDSQEGQYLQYGRILAITLIALKEKKDD